jgi:ABC-2 type transport system ATP-binding protein
MSDEQMERGSVGAAGAEAPRPDAAPRPDDAAAPRPDDSVVLAALGLTKRFGRLTAVDHVDFSVCRGDVYGFLGPNGAGKTTVIRMVLGLIAPTEGRVEGAGHRGPGDRVAALRHIGGFVESPVFYEAMSARRNLRLLADMGARVSDARIAEVLALAGLTERADDRVRAYSHGMKQRLGIAQALLEQPDLIVLDEPTNGLDPAGMKDVRELIRELGRQGTTVFLSSHLLHEVEQVCTRAAIVDRGRVVVEGPVAELRSGSTDVKLLTGDQERAERTLAAMLGASAVTRDGEHLLVRAADDDVPEMVRRLVADGVDVRAVVPAAEGGLEEAFLALTGRGETEASAPTGAADVEGGAP